MPSWDLKEEKTHFKKPFPYCNSKIFGKYGSEYPTYFGRQAGISQKKRINFVQNKTFNIALSKIQKIILSIYATIPFLIPAK